jgi:hypothetical protein
MGALQGANAARGEGEIDGAAPRGLRLARIGAPVVQRDGECAPHQEQREQRASQSRADDADRL